MLYVLVLGESEDLELGMAGGSKNAQNSSTTLTTASCSFSSSICSSAGVMGRGCRIGTPFSKLPEVVTGLSGGNGCPA